MLGYISSNEVMDHDVLFGRGKESAQHVGNISFRAVIESKFEEYLTGDVRGVARARLFVEISDSVVQAGGRFLKKAGNRWVEVDMATARCKVAQHFRDGVKLRRKSRQLLRGCEFALEFVKDGSTRSFGEMVRLVSERLPLEKDYSSDPRSSAYILSPKQRKNKDTNRLQSVKSAALLCPDLPKSFKNPSRAFERTYSLEPLPISDNSFSRAEESLTNNEDEFMLRMLTRAHELVDDSISLFNDTTDRSFLHSVTSQSNEHMGHCVTTKQPRQHCDTLESWSEITQLLDF